VLEQLPQKKALVEKLTALMSLESIGQPVFRGNALF
jgi:hypothetical protein